MIPRSSRLPKSRIAYLLRKGHRLGNEYFTLKFLSNVPGNKHASRFCVIVSMKVEPGAVKRNRLRRQIYEIVRLNCNQLRMPCDIVIIGKPKARELTFAHLRSTIVSFFKKISPA